MKQDFCFKAGKLQPGDFVAFISSPMFGGMLVTSRLSLKNSKCDKFQTLLGIVLCITNLNDCGSFVTCQVVGPNGVLDLTASSDTSVLVIQR